MCLGVCKSMATEKSKCQNVTWFSKDLLHGYLSLRSKKPGISCGANFNKKEGNGAEKKSSDNFLRLATQHFVVFSDSQIKKSQGRNWIEFSYLRWFFGGENQVRVLFLPWIISNKTPRWLSTKAKHSSTQPFFCSRSFYPF